MQSNRLGQIVGALLGALSGAIFCNTFLGSPLVLRSYDSLFALRRPSAPPEVVVVYIDERSHEELAQAWERPWSRKLHAELVERLKIGGARTVVFDVLFTASEGPGAAADEGTPQLAAAMKAHGRVVLASHLRQEGRQGIAQGISLETPDEVLSKAAAGIGVAEVLEDNDTVVRHIVTDFPGMDGARLPTLAAEVVRVQNTSAKRIPAGGFWLNYYGSPGSVSSESYYRALRELPPGYFTNKIVVIGEFYPVNVSGARVDTFRSPYGSGRARFAGAEIHATAIGNLLSGAWLTRLPSFLEFTALVLLGGLLGALFPQVPPVKAVVLAICAAALIAVAAFVLHAQARLWFPWLIPVFVQVPVVAFWAVLWQTLKSYMDRQILERSLGLYLSPKQVTRMVEQPELLKPGGLQQQISILASDITNFSKISSRMDPEDLLRLLNAYYEESIACIHETDGTVVKLIGDAIFAVWNAPQEQEDHRERACRAALLLHSKVVQFDQRMDVPPLITRLGLHTGQACVGNLGSSSHFDYTAIGESVNLAFRLEGLNKQLGTTILASRDFLKGLDAVVETRMVGHFRFKGFDGVVEVHEVLGSAPATPRKAEWRSAFAQGVHAFQRGELPAAQEHFNRTLALRPGDGPSQFLLRKISEMRPTSVSPDWAGEIDLDRK